MRVILGTETVNAFPMLDSRKSRNVRNVDNDNNADGFWHHASAKPRRRALRHAEKREVLVQIELARYERSA